MKPSPDVWPYSVNVRACVHVIHSVAISSQPLPKSSARETNNMMLCRSNVRASFVEKARDTFSQNNSVVVYDDEMSCQTHIFDMRCWAMVFLEVVFSKGVHPPPQIFLWVGGGWLLVFFFFPFLFWSLLLVELLWSIYTYFVFWLFKFKLSLIVEEKIPTVQTQ